MRGSCKAYGVRVLLGWYLAILGLRLLYSRSHLSFLFPRSSSLHSRIPWHRSTILGTVSPALCTRQRCANDYPLTYSLVHLLDSEDYVSPIKDFLFLFCYIKIDVY